MNQSSPVIYKIKPVTGKELLKAWALMPLMAYEFSKYDPSEQEQSIAVPQQRLKWAKIWMWCTLGGLWWWWRFFAKKCENCNCVWSDELINTDVVEKFNENYTYQDEVKTRHYSGTQASGTPLATSVTKVDKVGVKEVTVADNTYRCLNCGHEHERREKSERRFK